jgi:hypothetical protein
MNRNSSAFQVWQGLSAAVKNSAAHSFWTSADVDDNLRQKATGLIAIRCKMREKSISKYPVSRKAQLLLSVASLPADICKALFRAYLLASQMPMISAFLDSLSIKYSNGLIDPEEDLEALSPEAIKLAATKLLSMFDPENVELYFWVHLQSGEAWKPLDAFFRDVEPKIVEEIEDDSIDQEIRVHAEGLTRFDDLITLAIIDSAADVHSTFSREHVLEIVDEALHLNVRRHQSYFHRGYAEAMFDLVLQPDFAEENPSRRLWYLTGAIVALARKQKHSAIADLCEAEDLGALGAEIGARSRAAARFVFDALCLTGKGTSAAAFLKPELVPFLGLFDHILEVGTKLLRNGEIENADAVLKLLDSTRAFYPDGGLSKELEINLKRRRAHCLRLKRQYGEAKRLLQDLAEEADEEKSVILTDLAMVASGFRGLVDIAIPEKSAATMVSRFKQMQPALIAAAAVGNDASHAEFCLGVLALAEGDASSAATLLERSVTKMLTRPDVYNYGDLLPRARFYLALALAETLDETRTGYSVHLFNEALRSGHLPIAPLLRRYIEALLMVCPDEARVCAEQILPDVQLGPKILEALAATELLRKSKPILQALYTWSCDSSRPKKSRFEDFRAVLREALLARDIDLAENALDQMEVLAQASTCSREYIALLQDPGSYDPAWTATDASWSCIRVLETLGDYQSASELLTREFHRRLASNEYGAVDEGAEILSRIKSYGLTTVDFEALEARLTAVSPRALQSELPLQDAHWCITVVGGDELESKYDEAIRNWCKTWNPQLELHFRHTNWSSNHGDQLESMKNLLQRSDAVVVLRRIRTTLGRNVRRISKFWVGCAGESKGSIQRALTTAAWILAGQNKSNVSPKEETKGASA